MASGLDVQRLLIFREIARAGSIASAARSLGWTQPAVSQHLRHLERQAGTPLVLRRPRGVQLTEAGRTLLRHAEAIATRLRLATDELDALVRLRAGSVRLAAFPSAGATIVPAAMGLLAGRHPGLDVRLREAEPPQALGLLAAGEVDLAVTFAHPTSAPHPRAASPRARSRWRSAPRIWCGWWSGRIRWCSSCPAPTRTRSRRTCPSP